MKLKLHRISESIERLDQYNLVRLRQHTATILTVESVVAELELRDII